MIVGGWVYVKWAYGLSWLVLGSYAWYTVRKARKDI
jgi:hypothetical protein